MFPWVLTNYSSSTIDLTDEANYRNLAFPIGRLNEKRFASFKERYNDMPEPKYLYGTHYSNPAYVIGYLLRKYPQYMLKLHSGKFELINIQKSLFPLDTLNKKQLIDLIDEAFAVIESNEDILNYLTKCMKERKSYELDFIGRDVIDTTELEHLINKYI